MENKAVENEQNRDSFYQSIINTLQSDDYSELVKRNLLKKRFILINKILYKLFDSKYRLPRVVLTPRMLRKAFEEYHTFGIEGHFG